MTTVWIVHPQAVYHHEPLGVFSTEERAKAARNRAERYSDGHHDITVTAYNLDAWNLDAFRRLGDDGGGTRPINSYNAGRSWEPHPTDPADVEQAWS